MGKLSLQTGHFLESLDRFALYIVGDLVVPLTEHLSLTPRDHYSSCALKQLSSYPPHLLFCSPHPFFPGLALCDEVKDILSDAELPDLKSNLLLPEDVALRNLPPLKNAHKRFNFEQDRPIFSAVEEVSWGKS